MKNLKILLLFFLFPLLILPIVCVLSTDSMQSTAFELFLTWNGEPHPVKNQEITDRRKSLSRNEKLKKDRKHKLRPPMLVLCSSKREKEPLITPEKEKLEALEKFAKQFELTTKNDENNLTQKKGTETQKEVPLSGRKSSEELKKHFFQLYSKAKDKTDFLNSPMAEELDAAFIREALREMKGKLVESVYKHVSVYRVILLGRVFNFRN